MKASASLSLIAIGLLFSVSAFAMTPVPATKVKSKESEFGAMMHKVVRKPTRTELTTRAKKVLPTVQQFEKKANKLRTTQQKRAERLAKEKTETDAAALADLQKHPVRVLPKRNVKNAKLLKEIIQSCSSYTGARLTLCLHEAQQDAQ